MEVLKTSSTEETFIKIVVAGESGNGKTSLAKTIQDNLGERVLIISAEAGLLSLRGSNIDYIELQRRDGKEVPRHERAKHLGEIYKWLMLPEQVAKYKWIFIDSLTEVNQAILDAIESKEEFQGPKNTIKKYGELASNMMSLCKLFRDINNYNVIFSCLVKTETDNDGIGKMKVAIIGAFADRLPALFDLILYLGVSKEVGKDGKNNRFLLTQKTDRIDFPKDRSGKLDRIEPADLAVIVNKIRNQQTKGEK